MVIGDLEFGGGANQSRAEVEAGQSEEEGGAEWLLKHEVHEPCLLLLW